MNDPLDIILNLEAQRIQDEQFFKTAISYCFWIAGTTAYIAVLVYVFLSDRFFNENIFNTNPIQ